MATEHEHMHDGALARLRDILMRSSASEATEDVTGSLPRAWWRVAIHPMPATFRAWGRRAGPLWIITSLLVGSVLEGLSRAIDGFHVSDVMALTLNPQGRYLTQPTTELVVARGVANMLALVPLLLAVLLAIAFVTRQHQAGGLRAQLAALLPPWALALPAFGLASCINSIGALGLAAVLQWMHATPPAPLAALALDFLSFPLVLLSSGLLLGYLLVLLFSAVLSVVPSPRKSVGWLAFGVYLAVSLLVGLTFTSAAQALGIPGPLFG